MVAESMDLDQLQSAIAALTAATPATAALITVLSTLAGTPSYANDAAAQAGGVTIGGPTGIYRNGNIVQVRVS
jgi:hypothetical protein